MSRRVNGEGCWGKKKSGNIVYHRFTATINGRQKDFYGRTKTEAREKYENYLKEHGKPIKRSTMTLSEAAHEMLALKKTKIKRTTYAGYETEIKFLERHSISREQVAGLTTKDIQKYLDSLVTEKAVKGIKAQKLIIKMSLDYCRDFGYITEDIMAKTHVPAEERVEKETRQIVFLTTEERQALEKAAFSVQPNGKPWFPGNSKYAIVFILHTGLRVSELVALEWEDYDPEKKRIHVSKNAPSVPTENGYKQIVTSPKTKNSVRNIPLDDTAMEIINALEKERKPGQKDQNIMFPSNAGTMLRQRNIMRTLDLIVKRSGIDKKPTLHDLRHTFASELIRNGANYKMVSKVLGHTNASTTMNIYVHMSDEDIDGIKGLIKS